MQKGGDRKKKKNTEMAKKIPIRGPPPGEKKTIWFPGYITNKTADARKNGTKPRTKKAETGRRGCAQGGGKTPHQNRKPGKKADRNGATGGGRKNRVFQKRLKGKNGKGDR